MDTAIISHFRVSILLGSVYQSMRPLTPDWVAFVLSQTTAPNVYAYRIPTNHAICYVCHVGFCFFTDLIIAII